MIATICWKNHAGSNKCVYGFFSKILRASFTWATSIFVIVEMLSVVSLQTPMNSIERMHWVQVFYGIF